jgi:NADPH:quinone reductase
LEGSHRTLPIERLRLFEITSENQMQAAFYKKQGPAREVLQVGEQPTPEPGSGEVRVHLKTSGVNPSDWKSRSGRTAPMSAPLIIPHSDGAGDIDRVGPGVSGSWSTTS